VARDPQISAKAQQQLGLPEGFKTWSPFPFGGMNAQASPIAIPDNEFTYVENYVRLGDGNLRTLWDAGSAIYTAPDHLTVVWYIFYVINLTQYCAVFLSDGSAVQVNMPTFAQTIIGKTGFYDASTGFLPYAKQWGSLYLLICNRNTPNDYWVWDGSILYGAGTITPNGVTITGGGSGYSSTPTVTAYGGTGSGIVLQAVVTGGSVTGVNIIDPGVGYLPNELVTLGFNGGGSDQTPVLAVVLTAGDVTGIDVSVGGRGYVPSGTVTITGGGGSGATASAIVNGSGVITSITVTEGGSGYTSIPTVTVTGGTVDATAVAVVSGVVASVDVTNGGDYKRSTVSVSFSGGGGTGAAGYPVMAIYVNSGPTDGDWYVASVVITNAGSGYTSAPTVTFPGTNPVVNATGTAVVNNPVTAITLLTGGSGYPQGPVVSITGGGGSGATGVAFVSDILDSIPVTNGGSGYATPPIVQIAGVGTGATATAVVSGGIVTNVFVTNPGSGYTTPPTISFVGSGTGAAATATITGTISGVSVTAAGTNYTSSPNVTITQTGGSGAEAYALVSSGTVASVIVVEPGTNLTKAPILTVVGGGGSGAVLVATISGGGISGVSVSAAGSGYTSTPIVVVGAGENNAAYATLAFMPFGISGSAMETYLSRVWIINPAAVPGQTIPPGNQWSFSAPGSVTDFATSDGGGSSSNTDAFLQTQYVNVRQSSGYLYFYGDGSVSSVSNVNTSGTPATTTFNYLNIDPQAGLLWRDSIQDFGKSTIIANETGIWGLFGGSLRKISEKLDQFLNSNSSGGKAVYPASGGVTPSSAIATIYNVKHYLNLMSVQDPDTGLVREVMVVWNEKDWTIASQNVALTFIATQKIASKYYAYGTDGNSIYPLFNTPSSTLTKRIDTKQYGSDKPFIQKQALALYLQGADNSAGQAGVSGALTTFVSGIPTPAGAEATMLTSGVIESFVDQPNFPSPAPAFGLWGTSMNGLGCVTISVRFTSTSPDFTLGNLVIGYADKLAYYGA
jgi:hypothetical protein